MILWRTIENYHFYPRFILFLLYVRWKLELTFVRRCTPDALCWILCWWTPSPGRHIQLNACSLSGLNKYSVSETDETETVPVQLTRHLNKCLVPVLKTDQRTHCISQHTYLKILLCFSLMLHVFKFLSDSHMSDICLQPVKIS